MLMDNGLAPFLGDETALHDLVEARFKAIMEYSAVGLALVALEGGFVQVNRAVCELLGYSAEELLQCTFQELTHPEDLDTDLEHLRTLLEGEVPSSAST